MNKILSILAITLFLPACGLFREENYSVPTEFAPYVASFKAEAKNQGKNLKIDNLEIEFTDSMSKYTDSATTVGLCIKYEHDMKPPKILILRDEWEYGTESFKTALMYHELGHCILSREHRSETLYNAGQIPVSVMYPYVIERFLMKKPQHFDVYMEELFNPKVNITTLFAKIYYEGTNIPRSFAASMSLMMGFAAQSDSEELTPDEHVHGDEDDCVKFITAEEVYEERAATEQE